MEKHQVQVRYVRGALAGFLLASLLAVGVTGSASAALAQTSGASLTRAPAKVPVYPLGHAKDCRPRYAKVVRKGRTVCLLTSGHSRKLPRFTVAKGLVRLDPSFTQSATDPLDTVWSYSVNSAPGRPLPQGVLSFRLQNAAGQSYECAINAGGSVTGSSCEIELPDVGNYTTIVEFVSGTLSSVETEVATVKPFPAHATFTESTSAQGDPILKLSITNQQGDLLPVPIANYQIDLTMSANGVKTSGNPLIYQSGTCVFSTEPWSGGTQTAINALCNGEATPEPYQVAVVPSSNTPSFSVTVQVTLNQQDLMIGETFTGYALTNPAQATLACGPSGCSWTT